MKKGVEEEWELVGAGGEVLWQRELERRKAQHVLAVCNPTPESAGRGQGIESTRYVCKSTCCEIQGQECEGEGAETVTE